MPNSFPCPQCQVPIPFDDWERGTEAYCPSCGSAAMVPGERVVEAASEAPPEATPPPQAPTEPAPGPVRAVPVEPRLHAEPAPGPVHTVALTAQLHVEPAPEPARAARAVAVRADEPEVFGAISATAMTRVVGDLPCPTCKSPVPITAQDYGNSTYCPNCGAEVPVGEALVTTAVAVPAGKPAAVPSPARRQKQPTSTRAWIVRIALGTAALIAIAFLIRESLQPSGPERPRSDPGDLATDEPPAEPDAHITIAAIEALEKHEDPADALAQVDEWRRFLLDLERPDSDPRLARLDAADKLLGERLRPPTPPPPASVVEFQARLKALTEAAAKIPPAPTRDAPEVQAVVALMGELDALLAAHPDELAEFKEDYRLVREPLQAMLVALEGPRPTEELLARARSQVETGHPTEALESLARARLKQLTSPLTQAQRQRLDAAYHALFDGPLRLAQGRRDLEEAQQADAAGNNAERDRLLRNARSFIERAMAHTEEADYGDLLDRLVQLENNRHDRKGSDSIQRVEAREAYEDALHDFPTWRLDDIGAWAAGCRKLHEVAAKLPEDRSAWRETLAELALTGLLASIPALPPDTAETADQHLATLETLRALAEEFDDWKSQDEWDALDRALRDSATQLAGRLADRAEEQRGQDRLELALATAEQAEKLSGDPDLTDRLRKLIADCRQQLADRADRDAQEAAWARLQALWAEKKLLDAWAAIEQFAKRFPDSERLGELNSLRVECQAALAPQVPALLAQAAGLDKDRKYGEFALMVDQLQLVDIPPDLSARFQSLKDRRNDLRGRADQLFRQAPALMDRIEEVVRVIDAMTAVLVLNPAHEEAQARLDEARRRGQTHARKLLDTCEVMQRANRFDARQAAAQRDRIGLILKIQPSGPLADRAMELLAELDKQGPTRPTTRPRG